MKNLLITILRDKNTEISEFRRASTKLATVLANETSNYLDKVKISLDTPLAKATGVAIKSDIVLVPILRAGVALLPAFMEFFPKATVGFVGLKRDEVTAIAKLYYQNLPPITKNTQVIVLDPMIATGGSGCDALEIITKAGVNEDKIIFAAVIAATEGIELIGRKYPKVKIIVAQIDKELNDKKYIVPGLGDFGDRYFGTL